MRAGIHNRLLGDKRGRGGGRWISPKKTAFRKFVDAFVLHFVFNIKFQSMSQASSRNCTTIPRYPIFNTRYSDTEYLGIREIDHGLCA